MGGGKERKGKERKGKEKENVKYIHIFRRSFVSCFNEHHQRCITFVTFLISVKET